MLPFDPYEENPDEWGGYVPPPVEPLPPGWFGEQNGTPIQPGGGRPPMPTSTPVPGTRWEWNDEYGAWVTNPIPGWTPPNEGPQYVPIDAPFGGGGGGYGGYGGYQAPSPPPALNYPGFNAPTFNAPAPFAYDPFAYENFRAPTISEAQNEPGFEYALNQGIKAFENSQAYKGTYKSGGTIKGLNDYARNMANQNYDRVFDRTAQTYDRNRGNAFGTWSANRNNAADAYATNYGISRDVFDRNYQGAKDEYAPKARAAELEFGRQWDQFAYEGDDAYRRWKAMIDANT